MVIMGDQFQLEIMTLDAQKKRVIEILICSEGGVVMDGYKIIGAMEHTKCKVDTFCIGLAASVSAVIFEMGRYRVMDRHGILMFHPPYGGQDPKALEMIRNSLISIISERTGKTPEEVSRIMDANTWMDAEMALKMGFCDEIRDIAPLNKGRASKATDTKAIIKEFSLVLNKIADQKRQKQIEFKDKKDMSKIANLLNLNAEASEDAIAAEITKIINKSKNSEEEMDSFKKKMDKAKEEYDALKEEYDKMKNAFGEKEKEAEEKDKAGKEEKAKNLVAIHVARKAISNKEDIVKMWVDDAVVDFDKAKAKLEAIPVNNKEYADPTKNTKNSTEFQPVDNRKSAANAVVMMAGVIAKNKQK